MPPPYDRKRKVTLERLIKNQSDAPEDWPRYPVYLRGQAETYDEGKQKVKQLKTEKAYAYSTENDEHAKEKSAYYTEVFKKKGRKIQNENVEEIMYGSVLEESSCSGTENSSAESLIDDSSDGDKSSGNVRPSSNKENASFSKKLNASTETNESSVMSKKKGPSLKKLAPIPMMMRASEDQSKNVIPFSSQENVSHNQKSNPSAESNGLNQRSIQNETPWKETSSIPMNTSENQSKNPKIFANKGNVPRNQRTNPSETDNPEGGSKANRGILKKITPPPMNAAIPPQSKIVPSSSSRAMTCNDHVEKDLPSQTGNLRDLDPHEANSFSKETLLLYSAIKSLTAEVTMQHDQIRLLRNCINRTLKISVTGMTVEDFAVKYKITLKLDTLQALKDFEDELTTNKECLIDFTTSLKHFVEADVYKTILAILKKLLDREVAMQCTAVRDSKNKFNMKDTTFCKALFELACKNCTYESGKPITEKIFNKALGSIFNNAKDWDGQRNVRRLVHNPKRKGNENSGRSHED